MSEQRWFRSLYATLDKDQAEACMRGYVTHAQFRVWLAIFDHTNRSTGEAWPSKRRLAELTNLSRTAVTESIQALVDLGWIVTERRHRDSDGGCTSNLYRLAISPPPPAAQADPPGRPAGLPPGRPAGRHEPITNQNQEPKKNPLPPTGDYELEGFAEAWSLWRKGSAKKAAGRAWKAALKKKGSADLLSSMARWLHANRDTETRYLPALAVWLNGERWDDEVSPEGGSAWKLR